MKEKIWLSSPHMGGEELKYIHEAFETNWIAPLGKNVNEFEEVLAKEIGVKDCSVLSSGTAALHLALILLGIEAGDEVLCSSFTFSASANPIVYQGATPVFVDSEEETWNISPVALEEAIKDRMEKGKKPKAMIVVHLYGQSAKMDEIVEISKKYQIPIVEDAAEALGSSYKNKKLGSFGELAILSFNGNKIITTSGGGALVSNNSELIKKSRFLATQARDNAPHYQHSEIGYNYRMSNVVAGIGLGQMKVLADRVSARRKNYEYYRNIFKDIEGITFQPELEGTFSNRWLTCILVDSSKTNGVTREDLRLALEEENIEARPLWKPMHLQPVFEKYPYFGAKTSEKLFEIGLCLPSGSNLSKDDLERVSSTILRCIKK